MTSFVFHMLKGKSFSIECPKKYSEDILNQIRDEMLQFIEIPGYCINKNNINYVEVLEKVKRK